MKYTINLTCNQEEHFSFNLVTHRLKAKEEGGWRGLRERKNDKKDNLVNVSPRRR